MHTNITFTYTYTVTAATATLQPTTTAIAITTITWLPTPITVRFLLMYTPVLIPLSTTWTIEKFPSIHINIIVTYTHATTAITAFLLAAATILITTDSLLSTSTTKHYCLVLPSTPVLFSSSASWAI